MSGHRATGDTHVLSIMLHSPLWVGTTMGGGGGRLAFRPGPGVSQCFEGEGKDRRKCLVGGSGWGWGVRGSHRPISLLGG